MRDARGQKPAVRSSIEMQQPQDGSDTAKERTDATGSDTSSERADATAIPTSNETSGGSHHATTKPRVYHTGLRLHALTAGICLSLLLSTMETTIVSTSLVSIVDGLQGWDKSSWVVTSYLLTYTGFLIVYAKLSDIIGPKLMLLSAIGFFTIFSIACGAANSMLALIVLRAFQGLGGSGIYSLCTIMVTMMVPPAQYGTYVAITSSTFVLSSVLGPILGGAINDNTTWRWVFYFNGPGGALAWALVAFAIPFGFPYGHHANFLRTLISERAWRRIDGVGIITSLAASVLLVFALEQGGVAYAWNNAAIIVTFVLSGVLWIVFVIWERRLSKTMGAQSEPMFPWRLAQNRFILGLMCNGFLTGFPFMAAIFNIPQRVQSVDGYSPIGAAVRLLPLLTLSPFATAISGLLVTKLKIPPLYVLALGGCLQTIGTGLFSSIPSDLSVAPAQYGYQVLMGLGFGFNLATILIMVPMVVTEKDTPVAMASVTQIRVLGGTIGLAACSALLIDTVKSRASQLLSPEELSSILQSTANIAFLPSEKQAPVKIIFADGYSRQMRVMMYFSIAALVSLFLLVEKKPRRVVNLSEAQISAEVADSP